MTSPGAAPRFRARPGVVYLVGAGPGDPGLLTLKGRDILATAGFVVYDRLAHPDLLQFAGHGARLIDAGKEAGSHEIEQPEINALLVSLAKQGGAVCRLKGGDPFVFGRGGEEALACAEAGVPYEVVPGVSSAIAGPAYAGIPVTHRNVSSSLSILLGRPCTDVPNEVPDGVAADTRIFLMAVSNLPRIVENLLKAGDDPETPCALIERATWPSQRTIQGTLSNIASLALEARASSPGLLAVGRPVLLREKLAWFERRPLFGWRILVTRPAHQARDLSIRLRDLGADVAELSLIEVEPPADTAPLDEAIRAAGGADWIVFTSPNGVRAVSSRLDALELDVRAFGSAKVAAVGPGTARALREIGIRADFVPASFDGESLGSEWPESSMKGKSAILFRSTLAGNALPDALLRKGATVRDTPAYSTLLAGSCAEDLRTWLVEVERGCVAFASSSAVSAVLQVLGGDASRLLGRVRIACIGPITSRTARDGGLRVDVQAKVHTIEGLCDAIESSLPAIGR